MPDYSVHEYNEAFAEDNSESFKTSESLLNKGMCVYRQCGRLLSFENRYCKTCHEWAFIITEQYGIK